MTDAKSSEKTVTLYHPDSDNPIEVGESDTDRYVMTGWTTENPKKSTNK
jgi:hypothetical protein